MNPTGFIGALALLITLVAGLVAVQPAEGHEIETRAYVGLWTEHYVSDDPEYNEDNEIVQLSIYDEDKWFATVAKFQTSHFDPAHLIGAGREFESEYIDDLSWGVMLAAVHGYEGEIKTHFEGIIFAPVTYYKYKIAKAIVVGPVVNVGVEFKF